MRVEIREEQWEVVPLPNQRACGGGCRPDATEQTAALRLWQSVLLKGAGLTLAQNLVRESLLDSPQSPEDSSKAEGHLHHLGGVPMVHI